MGYRSRRNWLHRKADPNRHVDRTVARAMLEWQSMIVCCVGLLQLVAQRKTRIKMSNVQM
jgi:hypothetical protein